MAIKISALPAYSGSISGSFFVMDDYTQTTTYKVTKEIMFSGYATTGSTTFSGSVSASGGFTGSLFGTASYSVISATASYALNAGGIDTGSIATTGSNRFNGNQTISGSLNVSSSAGNIFTTNADIFTITGSLFVTGSTALTGSLTLAGGLIIVSGSGINTLTASSAISSSWITGSVFTSTNQALTSSFALTASYYNTSSLATTGSNLFIGNQNITGSLIISSSTTSSFSILNADTLVLTGSAYISGSLLISSPSSTSLTIKDIITGSIAAISASGYNTKGGNQYFDFLAVTNTSSSAVAPSKWFRLNGLGTMEIINSPYSGMLLSLSDNGQLSLSGSITMPNRPAFRVVGTSSTNIATPTTISGSLASIDYNQGSYYNSTNGTFTAPIAGLYNTFLNARVSNINAAAQIIVYKNASPALMWEIAGNGGATHFGVSGIVNLAVGDTLKATVTVGSIQFDGNDSWGAAYVG
jgi:hypothetical protein